MGWDGRDWVDFHWGACSDLGVIAQRGICDVICVGRQRRKNFINPPLPPHLPPLCQIADLIDPSKMMGIEMRFGVRSLGSFGFLGSRLEWRYLGTSLTQLPVWD